MKKAMYQITFSLFFLFFLFCILFFYYHQNWMQVCAITFGTSFFHFFIRLLIGSITHYTQNIHYNVEKGWFKERSFESKIYDYLHVKEWKNNMPTYSPESFSLEYNTLDEIIHNMCDSELVHTLNVLASYIPLAFSYWFGVFPVFLMTSFLGSLFDLCFVLIQRYNRPRVIKINKRRKKVPIKES